MVVDVPSVMSWAFAHRTASAKYASSGTSSNPCAGLPVGPPASRHRKVTIWARLSVQSGSNRSFETPVVMPSRTIQRTGSWKNFATATSQKVPLWRKPQVTASRSEVPLRAASRPNIGQASVASDAGNA